MIKYSMVCIDIKSLPLTKNKIYEISSKHWNQNGNPIDINGVVISDEENYRHGIIDTIDVVCDDGISRSVSYLRFKPLKEIRNEKLNQILE